MQGSNHFFQLSNLKNKKIKKRERERDRGRNKEKKTAKITF